MAFAAAAAVSSAQASVEISSNPTHNMNCTGGVCTPTAKNADLNATDLANMLAGGDVKVVTGSGAVTITVSSSFSWTSNHRLTLDANLNVSFRAPVVVAGQGAVTIVTNDGDLLFFPGASLDFWDAGSSLIINGTVFSLVSDIATLASDITANPSGIYALTRGYDASVGGDYYHDPIQPAFGGTFEGLGHAIKNFTLRNADTSQKGFFASIAPEGVIRDLAFENAKYVRSVKGSTIGLLAAHNEGFISHVTASLILVGRGSGGLVGGLIGWNEGLERFRSELNRIWDSQG